MTRKQIFIGAVLAVLCATAVLADEQTTSPAQTQGGVGAAARTVVFLPFKGVVCVGGALASFPVYWLSGLDPQVKADTAAMRAEYCSRRYLLGPEWTK
jgi:hypothetical protein